VRTFSKSLLTSRLHQDLDLKNTNTSGGYYRKINQDLAGNVILDEGLMKKYQRQNFVLLGIGLSYKPQNQIELYGNVSQNYRSVTFNDIRTGPSSVIDPYF
jgi:Fe(3+) dicitrate transport protein